MHPKQFYHQHPTNHRLNLEVPSHFCTLRGKFLREMERFGEIFGNFNFRYWVHYFLRNFFNLIHLYPFLQYTIGQFLDLVSRFQLIVLTVYGRFWMKWLNKKCDSAQIFPGCFQSDLRMEEYMLFFRVFGEEWKTRWYLEENYSNSSMRCDLQSNQMSIL